MKTTAILVIGLLLGYTTKYSIDFYYESQSPSPEAQVIIDSMKNLKGWRCAIHDSAIVNEEANTIVTRGDNVKVWDSQIEPRDQSRQRRELPYIDEYFIGKQYLETRRKLEVEKFNVH